MDVIKKSSPMDVLWFRLSRRPGEEFPFFIRPSTCAAASRVVPGWRQEDSHSIQDRGIEREGDGVRPL
jgi:hypothetical protein